MVIAPPRSTLTTRARTEDPSIYAGSEASGKTVWVYGVGIDEPLRMTRHRGARQETLFYLQNANGNVMALSNASGVVVERYRYPAFGREVVEDASGKDRKGSRFGNPCRFQGRWRDSAEGSPLYYFRFRMYEPGSGRFICRDPSIDPANMGNQYALEGGNPVSQSDPWGLQTAEEIKNARATIEARFAALKDRPYFKAIIGPNATVKLFTDPAAWPASKKWDNGGTLAFTSPLDKQKHEYSIVVNAEFMLKAYASSKEGCETFERFVDMTFLHEAFHVKNMEANPDSKQASTEREIALEQAAEHDLVAKQLEELAKQAKAAEDVYKPLDAYERAVAGREAALKAEYQKWRDKNYSEEFANKKKDELAKSITLPTQPKQPNVLPPRPEYTYAELHGASDSAAKEADYFRRWAAR